MLLNSDLFNTYLNNNILNGFNNLYSGYNFNGLNFNPSWSFINNPYNNPYITNIMMEMQNFWDIPTNYRRTMIESLLSPQNLGLVPFGYTLNGYDNYISNLDLNSLDWDQVNYLKLKYNYNYNGTYIPFDIYLNNPNYQQNYANQNNYNNLQLFKNMDNLSNLCNNFNSSKWTEYFDLCKYFMYQLNHLFIL